MKKNQTLLVCFLVFLLSFTSYVGLFAPVKAETWVDITLPYTITESGNYRISAGWSGTGTALTINASNIVVDGQNKMISLEAIVGNNGIEILNETHNVLIRNINQSSAFYAVVAQSSNFTIQDSSFTANANGIFAEEANHFDIINCNVVDTIDYNFIANSSNYYTIKDCNLSDSHTSITTFNSTNFEVINSQVSFNSWSGFEAYLCENFTFSGCSFNNNSEESFTADLSDNFFIANCSFTNTEEGINLDSSNSFSIQDSVISGNEYNLIVENATDFEVISTNVTNGDIGFGIDECSDFRIQGSLFDDNFWGLMVEASSNFSMSNCNVKDNGYGFVSLICGNFSVKDCNYNASLIGLYDIESENLTVQNCNLTSGWVGLASAESTNVTIKDTRIENNSGYGFASFYSNNTLFDNNTLIRNGFDSPIGIGFGIYSEESNLTVTNSLLEHNSNAVSWVSYDSDNNSTLTLCENRFDNNSYTFLIGYELPNNYTNHRLNFYNNYVNDSEYFNPNSFNATFSGDCLPFNSAVFSFNTTFQAGNRVYSDGRMIGGNYWAHPDGTGPSQTGTDADHDGFIDAPLDLFGNSTIGEVYDYLPYSSDFVEFVDHITISPDVATIAAGTAINYTTTAYDQYGNSWNATAAYIVNGNTVTGSIIAPTVTDVYIVEASYGGRTATAYLTVTPAGLDHFTVLASSTATVDTPFNIMVIALDKYDNRVTSFAGTVSLTASKGTVMPSTSGSFTWGSWTGTVSLNEAGSVTINATENGHTGKSNTITVNSEAPTPTPSPTPTPTSTIIQATKEDGSKVNVAITGNITGSQITNLTITTNQAAQTTTVSFTLTGQSGDSGFSSMTLAKSAIPYGTAPIVYIDGEQAQNQGYTEDSENYYVWYTANFSTHQVQIVFAGQPTNATLSPLTVAALIAIIAIAVAVALVVVKQKRKTSKPTA